jgi:hypothetical protein
MLLSALLLWRLQLVPALLLLSLLLLLSWALGPVCVVVACK